MKTMLFLLLMPLLANGQISLQMRSGWAINTNEGIISAAANFGLDGFALSPEMIVTTNDNSPGLFGLKISYTYKFIQAGYGRYYALYSMDKYDSYLNGWSNSIFGSVHWRSWFIEYDYLNRNSILSLGFKENIGRLQ